MSLKYVLQGGREGGEEKEGGREKEEREKEREMIDNICRCGCHM